jgi:hypothetical protein
MQEWESPCAFARVISCITSKMMSLACQCFPQKEHILISCQ